MEAKKELPVLYILMRTDMASMNTGKAIAQGSHASNSFVEHMHFELLETDDAVNAEELCNKWRSQTTQGFGTVLTLGVNERVMREKVALAQEVGLYAKVVHDPTYPVRDGETTHYIPVDTCAWVYAPNKYDPIVDMVLGDLDLHP